MKHLYKTNYVRVCMSLFPLLRWSQSQLSFKSCSRSVADLCCWIHSLLSAGMHCNLLIWYNAYAKLVLRYLIEMHDTWARSQLSLDFISSFFTVLSSEPLKGICSKIHDASSWNLLIVAVILQHSLFILNILSDQITEQIIRCNLFPYQPFEILPFALFGSLQYRKTPPFCFKHLTYFLGSFNGFVWNSNFDHQILLNCHKLCVCQKSLSTWTSDAYVPQLPYVMLLVNLTHLRCWASYYSQD